MVDGHRDMEGWGVFSIFKESGRLLYRHFRILRPFIFAFLLPLALLLFLEVIGIAWVLASIAWLLQLVQPDRLGGIFGHYHRRHSSGFHAFHVGFLKDPTLFQAFQHNSYSFIIKLIFNTYTVTFLVLFITWLFLGLATSTIPKAIHHINSQNTSSTPTKDSSSSSLQMLILILIHSIFTTFRHFVYRIFILFFCFLVVDIFTFFIVVVHFYLFSSLQLFPYPLETVTICVSCFFFLILDSWFEVSI